MKTFLTLTRCGSAAARSAHSHGPPKRFTLQAAVLSAAVAVCFSAWSGSGFAQQLGGEPWPGTGPDYVDMVIGWDFTGMTDDDVASFWGIIQPLTEDEIVAGLTPEQRQAREQSRWAFMHAEEYWNLYAPQKTEDEIAYQEFNQWAFLHPDEYRQWADSQKGPEQLQDDAVSAWVITHPKEASALAQSVKTPEELQAQLRAQAQATNPLLKPRPIIQQVPFEDAAKIRSQTIPQP